VLYLSRLICCELFGKTRGKPSSSQDVAMVTDLGRNLQNDIYATDSNIAIPIDRC